MKNSNELYHGRTEKLLQKSNETLAILAEILKAQDELKIPGHIAELDHEISAEQMTQQVEANSLHLKSLKRCARAAEDLKQRQVTNLF